MPGAGKQPRRRGWPYELLEILEDEDHDPVAVLAERVLEHPQVAEVIERVKRALDRAGNAIDPTARVPRPRQRQRIAPPDPLPLARSILHFGPDESLTTEKITKRRRALAAVCHPDKGGSTEAMARLNHSTDLLLAAIK